MYMVALSISIFLWILIQKQMSFIFFVILSFLRIPVFFSYNPCIILQPQARELKLSLLISHIFPSSYLLLFILVLVVCVKWCYLFKVCFEMLSHYVAKNSASFCLFLIATSQTLRLWLISLWCIFRYNLLQRVSNLTASHWLVFYEKYQCKSFFILLRLGSC